MGRDLGTARRSAPTTLVDRTVGVASSKGGRATAVLLLCLAQAILLFVLSASFQFVAIHRMDVGNHLTPSMQQQQPIQQQPIQQQKQQVPSSPVKKDDKPVVAYVVTLTSCGETKRYTRAAAMGLATQGAAVLRHSIHLAHSQSNRYGYEMYALIHPAAKECSSAMSKLGYTTLIRNTPFDKEDIQKQFLREHVDGASCCGAKEYIKLYAYTLVDHPVAVILDLDSLVLKPLDDLFDALIMDEYDVAKSSNIPVHDEKNAVRNLNPRNNTISAFYTRDYNMVNAGREQYAGVQGGFLMVKPSERVFEEYIDIVLEGDYREGQGWGGKYGYFFGGMQVQGICAYFYEERHPSMRLELDRCRINAMVDTPNFGKNDKKAAGRCRDGRTECEDCRATDVSDILSAHFTLCQKPWECKVNWDASSQKLCSGLHREWFRIRRSFEESRTDKLRQLPDTTAKGVFKPDTYFGYCKGPGERSYLPVKV